MIMKPTTTPGNASGNVNMETKRVLPRNSLRVRKTPTMPEMASVTRVTPADRRMVYMSVSRYLGVVMAAR
jgi:hypothetical protein